MARSFLLVLDYLAARAAFELFPLWSSPQPVDALSLSSGGPCSVSPRRRSGKTKTKTPYSARELLAPSCRSHMSVPTAVGPLCTRTSSREGLWRSLSLLSKGEVHELSKMRRCSRFI